MLAKRISLQHFCFFGQHYNEWQNESQSRLRLNLEFHRVFREAAPIGQEIFEASMFSGISSGQQLQDSARSTQQLQQRQISKRQRLLTILGTLP